MNNKKYISILVFCIVIALGVGIAYYFDPGLITNMQGSISAGGDTLQDTDILNIDDASSSFPAPESSPDGDSDASATSVRAQAKQHAGVATVSGAASGIGAEVPRQIFDTVQTTSDDTSFDGDAPVQNASSSPMLSSSSSLLPQTNCSFPEGQQLPSQKIIFNEIAWMGSASSSNAEWMEIKNISSGTVDLSGWELSDITGKIKIVFPAGDEIAPQGLLLLSRASAGVATNTPTAITYSGDLSNAGDVLALMDAQCNVSDYLDASEGWPGGNNTTKATLERDSDADGWHTSALPGGTPGAENSAGPPPAQYTLSVAFEGNNAGATITSSPAGLVCGASCTGTYASGTTITLTPTAETGSVFAGWSGSCYGETVCSVVISGNMSLAAQFRSTLPLLTPSTTPVDSSDVAATIVPDAGPDDSSTSTASTTATAGAATDHILIATVEIAGASSSNDLVKLYNPTGVAIDMSGWKLHKKSQTGTDYSLKVFPAGSIIAAGQTFTWANSTGGFSDSVGANVSSTETLSADNSVALMDAAGNIVDAVAWGTGTDQYGEGPPYPTDPIAGQLLSRRSSDGVMVDTENNTNDFIIQ